MMKQIVIAPRCVGRAFEPDDPGELVLVLGGPASATFTDPTGPDASAISYDFFTAHPSP